MRLEKKIVKAIVALALSVLSASAWCDGWSGTYIASGRDVIFIVQLVESSGGGVVGRFKQVSISKDYKLDTVDAPLSGAAAKDLFVGKIEGPWYAGGNMAISGRRTPAGIELTGAGGLRAYLRPATDADEARALAVLRQSAEQNIAAVERQKTREQQEAKLKKRVEALQGVLAGAAAYAEKGSLTYLNYAAYPQRGMRQPRSSSKARWKN
ncbi:hypothetical protein [Variovorax sp. W2I14]|uniref:hypothetical protein n=1 Tax=Variovorax sp. W2I14 TaxID=3042290 RepID=UPI003D254B2C